MNFFCTRLNTPLKDSFKIDFMARGVFLTTFSHTTSNLSRLLLKVLREPLLELLIRFLMIFTVQTAFFSEGRNAGDCIGCFLIACGFPALRCLSAGSAYLVCLIRACGQGILVDVCLADCFLPI